MDSVLNQSLRPFEIIVADDCSEDGSKEVIDRYARAYPELVRPFYQSVNQGIPRNKTFAMEQVRGQYVTCLDGDDRFLSGKLEEDIRTFRANPEARIAFSNFFSTSMNMETGRELWAETDMQVTTVRFFGKFQPELPKTPLFRNELIEYEALKVVGFYDKHFPLYEDWEFRIRLTYHFKVAYTSKPLSEYRIHMKNV